MYEILEKVMLDRKNIHPNVDYPCGPTYHLMGIDIKSTFSHRYL